MAYRPQDLICTYGPYIFKGFADGDFLTTDQEADTADVIKGAGGESAIIVRDADQVATCEITIFADSVDNRILTQIYNAQRAPGAGDLSIFPLMVADPNTNEEEIWQRAVITKLPTRGRSIESIPTRVWTFKGVMKAVPLL
jgi:hypothetical protein